MRRWSESNKCRWVSANGFPCIRGSTDRPRGGSDGGLPSKRCSSGQSLTANGDAKRGTRRGKVRMARRKSDTFASLVGDMCSAGMRAAVGRPPAPSSEAHRGGRRDGDTEPRARRARDRRGATYGTGGRRSGGPDPMPENRGAERAERAADFFGGALFRPPLSAHRVIDKKNNRISTSQGICKYVGQAC